MNKESNYFFQVALKIARDLARDAIWYNDTCNWTGHQTDIVNGQYGVVTTTLAADVYNGLSGIARFLSIVILKEKDPVLIKTLEGTINTILFILENNDNEIGNFGFYSSKLGIGYSLWKIGKEQNRDDWKAKGIQIIKKLENKEPKNTEIDIIGGAAGAIPALIEIYEVEKDTIFLEIAKKCGDFLLKIVDKKPQYWEWITIPESNNGLTGYSHGASGIAVAFLELGIATKDNNYIQASTMAFNYENIWYNQELKNWPDLREYKGGTPNYNALWCHGAPGIALARLRAYQLMPNEEHLFYAKMAVETTFNSVNKDILNGGKDSNFSICHGVAGNSDVLISASEILNNPTYKTLSEQAGMMGFEYYHKTGLNWSSGVNDPSGRLTGKTVSPSLMLGSSGTGYFYMRLAFPKEFNSVLLVGDRKNK